MSSLLDELARREAGVGQRIEEIREQIASLESRLEAEEDRLSRLLITRETVPQLSTVGANSLHRHARCDSAWRKVGESASKRRPARRQNHGLSMRSVVISPPLLSRMRQLPDSSCSTETSATTPGLSVPTSSASLRKMRAGLVVAIGTTCSSGRPQAIMRFMPCTTPTPVDLGRDDGTTTYVHSTDVDAAGIAWTSGMGVARGYWTRGVHFTVYAITRPALPAGQSCALSSRWRQGSTPFNSASCSPISSIRSRTAASRRASSSSNEPIAIASTTHGRRRPRPPRPDAQNPLQSVSVSGGTLPCRRPLRTGRASFPRTTAQASPEGSAGEDGVGLLRWRARRLR
jgi:hypothetical protein